jgi:predicted DNA-binding protein (UPF0251 family)
MMTDDRRPLDERWTTERAMTTGIPEGVAAFPDQMPEPVDLALERLDAMPVTDRPELTVTEAAKATGVDRRTISRRLEADAFPNAHRAPGRQGQPENGPWLIPVADLIAAGLRPYAPTPAPTEPKATGDTDLRAELADALRRAEVAEHRRELAEHDRDAARAVATERAESLADLRNALRMLDAGPVRQATGPLPAASLPPARRRWWSRS